MGWLTVETAIGVVVAAVVVLVGLRDLRRAVFLYAVLGSIGFLQIGAFSGRSDVQGLLLAEVLATVVIGLWFLQRRPGDPVIDVPFNRWLLLMLPASVASFAFSLLIWDPAIDRAHLNPVVSVGQLLLFVWPIGTYFVVANTIDNRVWVQRFSNVVILLALGQLVVPFVGAWGHFFSWAYYFGLVASPLCFARCFFERSWPRWIFYGAITVLPMARGVASGKTFLYLYVAVVVTTVLWLKARRVLLFAVPLGVAAYLLLFATVGRAVLPDTVERLIAAEEQSSSWGGRSGRDALTRDALWIWSRHPVLGVGPGNSYAYMIKYSTIGTPHSQYLNLLVELGLVGLGLFLAFVTSTIAFGWRLFQYARGTPSEAFVVGWLASFVAMSAGALTGDFLLHSVRNSGLQLFSGFYIHWILLGVAVSVVRIEGVAYEAAPAESAHDRWVKAPQVWRQA